MLAQQVILSPAHGVLRVTGRPTGCQDCDWRGELLLGDTISSPPCPGWAALFEQGFYRPFKRGPETGRQKHWGGWPAQTLATRQSGVDIFFRKGLGWWEAVVSEGP